MREVLLLRAGSVVARARRGQGLAELQERIGPSVRAPRLVPRVPTVIGLRVATRAAFPMHAASTRATVMRRRYPELTEALVGVRSSLQASSECRLVGLTAGHTPCMPIVDVHVHDMS